jgi:hypothetical protein
MRFELKPLNKMFLDCIKPFGCEQLSVRAEGLAVTLNWIENPFLFSSVVFLHKLSIL